MSNSNEQWPAGPILFWGSFGTQTPAGKRFRYQFKICLAIMFAGFLAALLWSTSPGPMLAAILPGLGFTGIALSFRRYLLTLDELARRIQVESIAWTYLTGLALGPLLAGVMSAWGIHANFLQGMLSLSGLDASRSDLITPYIYVLFLEQTRTLWLYKVSRKYQ